MTTVDYSEIEELEKQQEDYLQQTEQKQNEIIDMEMQKTQNEVDKMKKETDEEVNQQGKALYTEYQKQSNPYGANAEKLASQGLAKSGYAESSQVSLYNTYQKNVTTLMTEKNKAYAEGDYQLAQAKIEANISKAQNALDLYKARIEYALQNYQLRYQKQRDAVSDEQWQKSYDLQREQFEYQKTQDAQSQANWEREYQLSLANSRQ